jgi:DNA-binding SARP family transcriptional activator
MHWSAGSSHSGANVESTLTVSLMGGFEVRLGGLVVIDRSWPRRKAKAIVKLLALQPDRSLHRECVFDLLWPDLEVSAAAANLRKNLFHLRKELGLSGVSQAIVTRFDDALAMAADVKLDIDEFRAFAREALAASDYAICERALEAYGGDLLPEDIYEEWSQQAREELRALHRRLQRKAAELPAADYDQRGGIIAAEAGD